MSGFGFEVASPEEGLLNIKHTILVMSGKGGVGKSFITVNIAAILASQGSQVGVLDADIHGPSVPKMLGVDYMRLIAPDPGQSLKPLIGPNNIKVISIAFLLPTYDTPVVWRGPLKAKAIQEFVKNLDWGDLDYLLVDLPPGTGDEPLSVAQELRRPSGAIIVTIPSEVSQIVVEKAVNFAFSLKIPVIGIVENMSGFTCPESGKTYKIFGEGGGERIAKRMKVPFLGKIPLDPRITEASDKGRPFALSYPNTPASKALYEIAQKIKQFLEQSNK
ncbi:MAG: Mrp/NBP35 family ATP-binding protein [Thermoprotei archaeon]